MKQAEKILLSNSEQGIESEYKEQKCVLRKASFNAVKSGSESTRKSKVAVSVCRREEGRLKKKNESRNFS
jgi:hypothetical protein